MEFMKVCGLRRSIRIFKRWEKVEKEKIQRILEVVRLATTCPGNLQPWRAVVVEQERLSSEDRRTLLAADNFQAAHAQAPVWIYWFADPESAKPEAFRNRVHELIDLGALPTFYGWTHETVDNSIFKGEAAPEGMAGIHKFLHALPYEMSVIVAKQETVGACAVACLAAVNEGLGTCLHMVAQLDKVDEVRQLLKVPGTWEPVWCSSWAIRPRRWRPGGSGPASPSATSSSTANTVAPSSVTKRWWRS
jgi:nitroreductase